MAGVDTVHFPYRGAIFIDVIGGRGPADHRRNPEFSGFESISWFGLLALAGTPAPIVNKLHQEASKVAAQPDMRARFAQLGLDSVGNPPAEFVAIIEADAPSGAKSSRMRELNRASKIF